MDVQKHIDVRLLKKRVTRKIDVVQFDTSIQLVFTVVDFEIPEGTVATLYAQKPSGKFVYQEQDITIADNIITIDLHNQVLTEHGSVPYQVRLVNGEDLVSTFTGWIAVEKSLADSAAVESETVISAFDEKTDECIAEIRATAQMYTADIAAAREAADAANEAAEYAMDVARDIQGGGTGDGGATGADGEDGGYYTPSVNAEGVLSWTASKTDMPSVPTANIKGTDGADGVSPTVDVSDITGGHRIAITDADGTKTVDVMDGEDGYSPTVKVNRNDADNGWEIRIQDSVGGGSLFEVLDGEDGADGADGNGIKSTVLNADYTLTLTFDDGTTYTTPSIRGATGAAGAAGAAGKDGTDGKDGVSATHSWNGTTLTVTSASGTSSADLKGDKGDPYTLTDADKTAIAQAAAEIVDAPEVVQESGESETAVMSQKATTEAISTAISGIETAGGGSIPVVEATLSGAVFHVTVPGVTELTPGMHLIMIPKTQAILNPLLNVNSLGSAYIVRPKATSTDAALVPTGTTGAPGGSWLKIGIPVMLMYDGTYWRAVDVPRIESSSIYGQVAIEKGGTGAGTTAEAATNLRVVSVDAQTLTEAEQAQARENIGAAAVGEGGGGGATTWDDLGSSWGNGTVLAENTPVWVEDQGAFSVAIGTVRPMTAGSEYTVNWNGTEYTCIAEDYIEEGVHYGWLLGNTSALGGTQENELPFVFIFPSVGVDDQALYALILPLDGSTSLTTSVTGYTEIITPVPAKYLGAVKGQQKITIYCDYNPIEASVSFDTAWEMDIGKLQSVMSVIYGGNEHAVVGVKKQTISASGITTDVISFGFSDVGDAANSTPVGVTKTRALNWYREPSAFVLHSSDYVSIPSPPGEGDESIVPAAINYNSYEGARCGVVWKRASAVYFKSIALLSPSGTVFDVTVDDNGNLTATKQ